MTEISEDCFDVVVIGAGFYGCALALELRRSGKSVALLEKSTDLMQRASYINQARVHQGYHYPRSVLTALRSRVNFERFTREYEDCVFANFEQYYAIGRIASKVNSEQFRRFCQRIGAPLSKASKNVLSLFDPNYIETVFQVREHAFDAVKLKTFMHQELLQAQVSIGLQCDVQRILKHGNSLRTDYIARGECTSFSSKHVLNCTYSGINNLLKASALPMIDLKFELAEMALVRLPGEIRNMGFTVMDGPFFSTMPFPARDLHSLSHVRYTPHHYWQDKADATDVDSNGSLRPADDPIPVGRKSLAINMLKDAQRYLPLMKDCQYIESLWEIKTVLPQSEVDDSRPILFRRNDEMPNLISIMGGKIDNIFDAREQLGQLLDETGKAS